MRKFNKSGHLDLSQEVAELRLGLEHTGVIKVLALSGPQQEGASTLSVSVCTQHLGCNLEFLPACGPEANSFPVVDCGGPCCRVTPFQFEMSWSGGYGLIYSAFAGGGCLELKVTPSSSFSSIPRAHIEGDMRGALFWTAGAKHMLPTIR